MLGETKFSQEDAWKTAAKTGARHYCFYELKADDKAKKADKIEVVGLVVEALPYTQFWSSWKTATASWRTLPARCAKYFSAFCWGGGARRDELYDHTRSISTLPRKASAVSMKTRT